ncbi:Signal recognition particle receptor FtsY [Buchnera aphidicola (Eriosoma lanigerum)]|uniref:signal recognition particle-docking protein FtsY n=1 Tax=Buchnera aphidicola TaxID=9 RepID=UPI003463B93F
MSENKKSFFSLFKLKKSTSNIQSKIKKKNDLIHTKKSNLNNNTNSIKTNNNIINTNIFNQQVNSENLTEIKTFSNSINHTSNYHEVNKNIHFFSRLKNSLYNTSKKFSNNFSYFFKRKKIDDSIFEQLEEKLLTSDINIDTSDYIIKKITKRLNVKTINDFNTIFKILKEEMLEVLKQVEKPIQYNSNIIPFVILVVGVNGVGKTTTIGKLAKKYTTQGKSVMLVAGDTFRSAAVDQLKAWGKQINDIPVISSSHENMDPSAIIFNAIDISISKKTDILIIDTAGRLHNKLYLMQELKKIKKVINKKLNNGPHEIILVTDACTGQNTITQTKLFHECLGITSIILTKLDGTAKGGVIFSLANNFKIPISYIGIGEKELDLREFNSKDFIDALFYEKY